MRRAAGVLVALGVLGAGFCWYGWRYGLTPLPEPVPGVALEFPPKLTSNDLAPTNYWHWVGLLESALPRGDEVRVLDFRERASSPPLKPAEPSGDQVQARFVSSLLEWSWYGAAALTDRAELSRWVAEHAVIDECYRNALLNPHGLGAELEAATQRRLAWHGFVLALYPLWLAQQAELEGRPVEAFDHLLAAWRTSAQANPRRRMDYAGGGGLARSWRRLALSGPPLPPDEGRRLLGGLSAATNLLPSLEVAYVQHESLRRDAKERACSCDTLILKADWAEVRREFRRAFEEIGEELLERVQRTAVRLLGDETDESQSSGGEGIWRLGVPLGHLLWASVCAAARPEDCQRLETAYYSQVLARLRLGQFQAAEDYARALRGPHVQLKLKAFLDRPGVWLSLRGSLPWRALMNSTRWRCSLETCRLTLALRLYRDCHGVWPERLEELVPEFLSAVPIEPCSDEPFQYRKRGDTWRVQPCSIHGSSSYQVLGYHMMGAYALHLRASNPAPGDGAQMPLCSSEEATEAAGQWESRLRAEQAAAKGPTAPVMMDLRMLQRYGLIPKGYKLTSSP